MITNNLDKAIKLHETHMKNPATATVKSQDKLMELLNAHKKEMEGSSRNKKKVK